MINAVLPQFGCVMAATPESDENGMPKTLGAINGEVPNRIGPVEKTVVTIPVDDVDAALKKIKQLGGKMAQPKMLPPLTLAILRERAGALRPIPML
jgi:predicted enzyme related to lactoylglutathione lyase